MYFSLFVIEAFLFIYLSMKLLPELTSAKQYG